MRKAFLEATGRRDDCRVEMMRRGGWPAEEEKKAMRSPEPDDEAGEPDEEAEQRPEQHSAHRQHVRPRVAVQKPAE